MPTTAAQALGLSGRPVLLLSPHLDDAWLSCAAILQDAAVEVWTVFAGVPEPAVTTTWDTASGFADSTLTMTARLAEDEAAFAGSSATVRRLGYLDGAYADPARRRADLAAFASELGGWIEQHPGAVVVAPICAGVHVPPAWWEMARDRVRRRSAPPSPDGETAGTGGSAEHQVAQTGRGLGRRGVAVMASGVRTLMHADHQRRRRKAQRQGLAANPDHIDVRDIAIAVCATSRTAELMFAEDLPYLWHARGHAQANRLARHGLRLTECPVPVDTDDKFDRLQHYASQLDALDPGERRLSTPGKLPHTETYWRTIESEQS